MSTAFVPGRTVDCYLAEGWKVLPPTRAVCRVCGTALLCHKSYPFVYCVDCAEKVVLQNESASLSANGSDSAGQAPSSREPCESEVQRTSSPSTLLGDLLLRGYAMSALPCPNGCNIPLARKPSDQSTVICVSCGFQSSDAAFAEPQPEIDSEEIARQIARKVKLIANQPSSDCREGVEKESCQSSATKLTEKIDSASISTAHVAESLRDKLVFLGKQLTETSLNPLTPATCQRVASLVSTMRDINDARRMLLESLES